MSSQISFCPVCAGKLETGDDDQFSCEECELHFLIEVVDEDEADDEDEDEDEDEDADDEETEKDDEY
jgi:hypothetical protein